MIRVSVDDRVLQARLERARQGVPGALERTAAGLGDQLLAGVRGGLASGPLADAYAVSLETSGNAVVVSLTNSLPYAAFYERGFQGTEEVSEHLRQMTEAFGHPVATPHEILVQSYSRRVDAPAHPVAQSALETMTTAITDGFTQAVLQELAP
ncbi:MAG TPA: hypothetical protein VM661_17035 [Candidatus Sulfotelmatobacter sp.]|jgi:hypothetical protein|nr:hypothetical protein [Candidatus Sulfotelmatobacter sp.]